ncbi:MAG: hypothetical protein LC649_11520 [Bacteroidales bacterium]|nr:hypothetical protein [Bacteroidales bacterium]
MRSYSLKIGGYYILFTATDPSLTLQPEEPQISFLTSKPDPNLVINVTRGKPEMPRKATPVFSAPEVEEIAGVRKEISPYFWTVYSAGKKIIIRTTLPLSNHLRSAILTIRPEKNVWDLAIDCDSESVNPLSYPLDGLIIYYLTALNGDILIHASGVFYGSKGYLFSGRSGCGKSTIAEIFDKAGAEVVHDDRLIIRRTDNRYMIYNTPVYNNEVSRSAPLDSIYLISHGTDNISIPVAKAEALALIMSNCIQHNWSVQLIGNMTGALHRLVSTIPVKRLAFTPSSDVIRYISKDD